MMEFVLVDAPQLDTFVTNSGGPDASAFAGHFGVPSNPSSSAVAFENLGRDAVLVSPRPDAGLLPHDGQSAASNTTVATNPSHLLAYVRTAPTSRQHEFWKVVGETWLRTMRDVADRGGDDPRWLSTSGMGIAYLHVRIDQRPKYYTYGPYKSISS
jgi:hypothetical protein